ncbi:protoporphyrinogen oxidase HemJ [Paracoccaceae bacterium GXU_MW_L88]
MNLYLWLKFAHIVSMVAWMAGLFYLPRLFVYHVERPQAVETFQIMEDKLYRLIMNPAMMATWVFGLALITIGAVDFSMVYMWVKLVAVIALTGFHLWLKSIIIDLRNGKNRRDGKFYRLINEIPTILLIIIVAMIVVKPF